MTMTKAKLAKSGKKAAAKLGHVTLGIELIDRRNIAFRRCDHPTMTTIYFGDWRNGSCLIKIEEPSGVMWTAKVDAWQVERAKLATRQLQGENLDCPEVKQLYFAVQAIKLRPDEIHNPMILSDGGIVRELVQQAILSGNPHNLNRLSRILEAVHNSGDEKRWLVAKSISAAAKRKNNVPTPTEALQEFANAGGDADAKNFRASLKDAGFGWLIEQRGNRS